MNKNKIMDELRALSVEALQKKSVELEKELFALRMQKASGTLEKPHLFRAVRQNIARVRMLLASKV